jgi:nitroreductase
MIEGAWQRWAEAAAQRVSRRRFERAPVEEPLLERLEAVCRGFRPFGPARAELVRTLPRGLFRGIAGAYGSVRGAPHALVLVGPKDGAAEVGYAGEGAVLEATALRLGTCWVAGLFDPEVARRLVDLAPGERVFAVSPVGRAEVKKAVGEVLMSALARSRTRKGLEEIAPGAASWPAWARAGAETARAAPSAMNRQPWRFSFEGGMIALAQDSPDSYRIPKRLDCGIAMLHFQLGAKNAGMDGAWRIEASPRVASFVPRVEGPPEA